MGQWYFIQYTGKDDFSWIYTFNRNEGKRNNTIYIQNIDQLLYFTYLENNKMHKDENTKKLLITDFRQGIIHIMFSSFSRKDKLLYEIESGDLKSYMEIV